MNVDPCTNCSKQERPIEVGSATAEDNAPSLFTKHQIGTRIQLSVSMGISSRPSAAATCALCLSPYNTCPVTFERYQCSGGYFVFLFYNLLVCVPQNLRQHQVNKTKLKLLQANSPHLLSGRISVSELGEEGTKPSGNSVGLFALRLKRLCAGGGLSKQPV